MLLLYVIYYIPAIYMCVLACLKGLLLETQNVSLFLKPQDQNTEAPMFSTHTAVFMST